MNYWTDSLTALMIVVNSVCTRFSFVSFICICVMNMVIPGQVFLKECIDSPYCKRSRLLLSFISSMRNVYLARETLRFGCCRISVFYPWLFLFGVSWTTSTGSRVHKLFGRSLDSIITLSLMTLSTL